MRCRSGLERLYLLTNRIGDSGAQALANALPQCGLKRLILIPTEIGDSGAQALAMRCRSVDWRS